MPRKAPATNPRGTLWSKDENRLGLRMMEKMGWKKGQGLGNKEDGILEPIKTRPKNNYKGVGFQDRDDQWMAHHDAFNALLKHLNDGNNTSLAQPNIMSLEEKSKNSKSRVHYKKIVLGKDLSRCTEKDFLCILGKPTQKESEEATSQPNINEYFEKKMAVLTTKRDIDTGLLKKDYKVNEIQTPKSRGHKHRIKKEKICKETMELKNVDNEVALKESSESYHDDGIPVTSDVSLKKKKRKCMDEVDCEMPSFQKQESTLEDVKISPKKIKISKQVIHTAAHKCIKNRNDLEQGAKQQRKSKKTEKIQQLVVENQDEGETVQRSKKSEAKSKKHLSHNKNVENNTTDNNNATKQGDKTEELEDYTNQRKKSKTLKHIKSLKATAGEQDDGGNISDDKQEDKGKVSEFRAQFKKMEQFPNNKNEQISDKTGPFGHQTTPRPKEVLPPIYWEKIETLMSHKSKTVELAKEIVELLEKAELFKGSNLFDVNGYGTPMDEYLKPMNAFTRRAPRYLNTSKRRPPPLHKKQHNEKSAQSHGISPSIPCHHPN